MLREHDAIVVGGSFAGLAVARHLRGRVLLVDRRASDPHAGGRPRADPHGRLRRVGLPYCTFDYRRFCRGDALYFWAAPGPERDVISWIFPVGAESRVGVGSYAGASKLKRPLLRFDEIGDLPLHLQVKLPRVLQERDHFLRTFAARNGKTIRGLTREARDALLRYDYPGKSASSRTSSSARWY